MHRRYRPAFAAALIGCLILPLNGCGKSSGQSAPPPVSPADQAKVVQDNPYMTPEVKARMMQLNRDPHSLGGPPAGAPAPAK